MSGSSSSLAYNNSAPLSAPSTGYSNAPMSFDDPLESPTLRAGAGLSRSNTTHAISRSPNLSASATSENQQQSLSRSRSMGHSRRLSSISYSSSPAVSRPTSIEGPPLLGLNISHGSAASAPGMSRRFSAERVEGLGIVPASPSLGSSTSLGGVSELAETESELDSEAERRRINEERASVAAAAQPTLIEANADLLSFIAKKERKCLDLREELKRHEGELGQLKKRWESIVAKSVSGAGAQPRAISPTNRFSLSLPRANLNREGSPSAGDRSPGGSPAGLHTLDMSLLASTFDASPGEDYNETVDLSAELSNAKAWMGSTMNGMLGKLADVVTTLEESFDGGQEGRLDVLAEEDEDESHEKTIQGHRRGTGEHQSVASASSVDERRISRASSASIDSASSFGFSSSAVSPTPSVHSDSTSIPSTSPTLGRPTGPPLSASARSRAGASPSTPSTASSSGTPSSHGRSFSLGSFSSVTASSWSSIGKKLSAATNSDTFKNGVLQASQLVDTFEKGLVSALGPLDGDLPPIEGGAQRSERLTNGERPAAAKSPSLSVGALGAGFAGWTRAASSAGSTGSLSPELGREGDKTPKPDTTCFPTSNGSTDAQGNKLGGYRRPSASTAAVAAKAQQGEKPPSVVEESDDGESWGAW